jgi:type VI secretion system protein VasG
MLRIADKTFESHMAAGQKPRQVTLGYHEEEGVVMAFDEGTISDE